MKNKISVFVLLLVITVPQVALAAWWNPFSWNWVQKIFSPEIEIKPIENTVGVVSVESETPKITEEKQATSSPKIETTKKETTTKLVTSTKTSQNVQVAPKPVTVKISEPALNTASTTSVTSSSPSELELLRQQNEILKSQLEAQQQIAQNTALVNGSCKTVINECATGLFEEKTDISTHYLWSCKGTNGGTTASCSLPIPPPSPIQFTAIKSADGLQTTPTCVGSAPNGDQIEATIFLGRINLSPRNYSGKMDLKVVLDITGQPTPIKTNLQVFHGGSQDAGYQITSGRNEFDIKSIPIWEDYSFWLKEVTKPLTAKITVESASSEGLGVQGLPIEFPTFETIFCQ